MSQHTVNLYDYTGKAFGFIDELIVEAKKGRVKFKLDNVSESKTITSSETFWDLLHPEIVRICRKKYEDGHRADSIETALKHVNNQIKEIVRKRTGEEFDGAALMNRAFSPNNPIISLADLSTESGKNIQKGYLQIFAGSMTGIRNPKAHDNINLEESRAIHLLFLSSLLQIKIEEAI